MCRRDRSRSDRYTLLADRTLEILTDYWFQCGRPRGILFPSSWTGDYPVSYTHLTEVFSRLLRQILDKNVTGAIQVIDGMVIEGREMEMCIRDR